MMAFSAMAVWPRNWTGHMMTFEGSAGRGKYNVASHPSHQNLSFGRTMPWYVLLFVACACDCACVCQIYHTIMSMYWIRNTTWQSAVASAPEVV